MVSNLPQNISLRASGIRRLGLALALLLGAAASTLAQSAVRPASVSAPLAEAAPAGTPHFSFGTSSVTPDNYLLVPTDRVLVKVFQEDDLLTDTRVSNDGTIVVPLIGSIHIGGLTVGEASQEIQRRLHHGYLVNPQVTVMVSEFSKRRFTVMGQVQKGGTYLFPDQGALDLLQAIGMAGGYTRIADRGHITVQRNGGGKSQTFRLNVKAMSEGKEAPFPIQPDDTITVGETWF